MKTQIEHIELVKYTKEGFDIWRPYGAYAKNKKTNLFFSLGDYSTSEKRDSLAPKLLEHKIKNPSIQFKQFLKTE